MGLKNLRAFINSDEPFYEGIIRVQSAVNDSRYDQAVIRLEDFSAYADVFADSTLDIVWESLVQGNVIAVTLRREKMGEKSTVLRLVSCAEKPDISNPVFALPHSACALPTQLERLASLHDWVTVPCLKGFLSDVLSDHSIVMPFLTRPASRHDHHSYPSGLLAHSVEVAALSAQWISRTGAPRYEVELAAVIGLFHDIGKILSHSDSGALTPLGHRVPHEPLGSFVLSEHLHRLMRVWPDGVMVILRVLNMELPRYAKNFRPESLIEKAVRHADYLSANIGAYHKAETNQRNPARALTLSNGRRFERLPPPKDDDVF